MPFAAFIQAFVQTLTAAVQRPIPGSGDSLLAACRAFSLQAGTVAVTALWQGAVVACGLAICLRLVPRTSAAHRFAVWAAAFVTLVALSILALVSGSAAGVVAGISSAAPEAAARPWLSIDARWSLLIAGLWAVASLFRAVDLGLHSFRLRKLWKDAIPVALDSNLNSMLASIWTRGPVQVCTTTALQRPSVIGFFKPRILIPDWLFARLTAGELEQIVLHEAEHLRRRDDWTNLFQKLCLVFFPLNPALVWIERRLCREREMACDDGVIRITHAPRAYAACLASLAERRFERRLERRAEALSLGAWQRRPELVHRVHSILRRNRALSPLATRVLLGLMGCGLLFGSVELARSPQLVAFVSAQNPEPNVAASQPPAQLVTAAYTPVRNDSVHRTSTGLQTAEVASSRTANHQPSPVAMNASLQPTASKQNAALEWKTSYSEPASRSPRPVMLKAELTSSEQAKAQDQEQQWLVITTWEQLQTPNQNAVLTADYETGANSNPANSTSAQPTGQPASQIIVTRLIFRIVPASSLSAQPSSAPMRSGWFVIQL
jgi:beta-lactamase regulating signal transducer with metallopeptidase domain